MSMTLKILALTALIAIPIVVGLWLLVRLEKKRKAKAADDFRNYSHNHSLPHRNLRGMKRLLIPADLDVVLSVAGTQGRLLRGLVRDISLSGVAVSMNWSRRNLHPGAELENAEVVTPLNRFRVERVRLVRLGVGFERSHAAFQFSQMESDQFDELQRFLSYLDGYQKHVPSGH